jgi:3-hydroxyacyl-CoA dehydrogenase
MTDTTLDAAMQHARGEKIAREITAASQSQRVLIRKAAVLGAGVMGAQIAAHLANANVQPYLFELAADGKDKSANAKKAIDGLAKQNPSPLATAAVQKQIIPANYDEHLALLAECDLVIEAISERMDWKKSLFEKVAPHIGANAIFASNTSGLSITELSKTLPVVLRKRFCGIHFFNPPRYMRLVELVPTGETDPAIMDRLETFLTTTLGKGVVRAKDTPNFVANRVGVFSMLATMHHTAAFKLGFDEVDALTGPAIGRGKSATYRTADVVGLDTMGHVIKTMHDTLPSDPWHPHYVAPMFLSALISKGALGAKTKAGFYTKKGKDILVIDVAKQDYVAQKGAIADEVQAILKEKSRRSSSRSCAPRPTRRRSSCGRSSATSSITARCISPRSRIAPATWTSQCAGASAGSWGPFELWQAAGWEQVAKWIAEDIAAGKTMAKAPLPAWVTDGRKGVHSPEGSYSAETGRMVPRSKLPVYARQLFPETVIGEKPPSAAPPSSRMTACACGTRATASPSSPSRARCIRSASRCSPGSTRRSTRPKSASTRW